MSGRLKSPPRTRAGDPGDAEEREVLKRAVSLLMERSQENVAVFQLLWFFMVNNRKGYCRHVSKLGYSLRGKYLDAVVARAAEKYVSYYNTWATLP